MADAESACSIRAVCSRVPEPLFNDLNETTAQRDEASSIAQSPRANGHAVASEAVMRR